MIIGHHKQLQYLRGLVKRGRIPHALLFSGQESLGKKTIALEFVKLLNCLSVRFTQKQTPCQKCLHCQEIKKGIYPDLRVVQAAAKEIHLAQIREIEQFLSSTAFYQWKVVLIDKAHLATVEAQNCLLKTLEEPKGNSILILITEYPERLLPTVLSRVQNLNFWPVPAFQIERALLAMGADKKRAKEISLAAWGRPGRAINLWLKPEKLKEEQRITKDLIKLFSSSLTDRFHYAKKISQEQEELKKILELWLVYFKNNPKTKVNKVFDFVKKIEKTLFLLSTTNINPRLATEELMLSFYERF